MKKIIVISLILALAIIFTPTEMKKKVEGVFKPRGLRNNNPGNIRKSNANWEGKTGDDGTFEIFNSMGNGVRALTKLICTYIKQGNTTIEKIVSKYAPSNENDTEKYIMAVANGSGIPRKAEVLINQKQVEKIVTEIIKHENGESLDPMIVGAGVQLGFTS